MKHSAEYELRGRGLDFETARIQDDIDLSRAGKKPVFKVSHYYLIQPQIVSTDSLSGISDSWPFSGSIASS